MTITPGTNEDMASPQSTKSAAMAAAARLDTHVSIWKWAQMAK